MSSIQHIKLAEHRAEVAERALDLCETAYVWNKDDDWSSEFGSVMVQSFGGGIRRIA